MNPINFRASAPHAIQQAIGGAIKAHVLQTSTISDFSSASGITRSSLYRLFKGESVGIDVLVIALQTLNRLDLLEALAAPPKQNPVDLAQSSILQVSKPIKRPTQRPTGFILDGIATAQKPKWGNKIK
ncbi:helix-turn-helix domain-containing protein [Cellvibrio sp. QJXJ]|uniref:helix-turn-helix domain-containing protein n=1 Tax=Cellvibrio sp. QJXJ TaxID=2964606 RepID=UPI0021C30789|nr:helix-turn-helix transcriptional regulator [Cellvibrio sp. QJXJ]UUA75153.1 helix-turn-helix transcriptional regulator [Cellvibrio sp. QJXJ]